MAATGEQVFLQLTILLSVAVASHFVIRRFRQPTIIGEIGIGVLLGPSVLGFVLNGWKPVPRDVPTPPFDNPPELVSVFAGLGAIFLLFLVGLETDMRAIYRKRNVAVAVGGVVLPWLAGFLTAYLMVPEVNLRAPRFVMAMFVGATLVATSTAIAAAILLELGMMRTNVANTIMGAVIVDDILGLLVLSVALGIAGGSVDVLNLTYVIAVALAFVILGVYVGTRSFGPLVARTQARGREIGLPHAGFMVALAVAFFMAFLSEAIRLSAVIGAFLAGTMFSGTRAREDFREGVAFLGAIFTPIFFISLGLLVNVWAVGVDLLLFGAVLLVVAFVTKLAGCGIPARWTGFSRGESLAVGYGMVPRGEVGLIIALAALQKDIIGQGLFSVIALVMVAISVLPAPLLRRSLLEVRGKEQPVAAGPVSGDGPPSG